MPSNIYIVDDDESVCRAMKTLLMTYEFEVQTFNSAQNYFDTASKGDDGCLLLDINMPEIDGWATQKILLDSGSKRPVIFISAEKQDVAIARALEVGAVGFLQKPVDAQTLIDLIDSAIKDVGRSIK